MLFSTSSVLSVLLATTVIASPAQAPTPRSGSLAHRQATRAQIIDRSRHPIAKRAQVSSLPRANCGSSFSFALRISSPNDLSIDGYYVGNPDTTIFAAVPTIDQGKAYTLNAQCELISPDFDNAPGYGVIGLPSLVLTYDRDNDITFTIAQTGSPTVSIIGYPFPAGPVYDKFVYCPNEDKYIGTDNIVQPGCVQITLTAIPAVN